MMLWTYHKPKTFTVSRHNAINVNIEQHILNTKAQHNEFITKSNTSSMPSHNATHPSERADGIATTLTSTNGEQTAY